MNKIKEMLNEPETGSIFKAIGIFSIFVLFFGLTLTVKNAGDTYAYTNSDCPSNWSYSDEFQRCKYYSSFSTLDNCKTQISSINVTYDGTRNYCHKDTTTNNYLALVHPDDTSNSDKIKATYVLNGGTMSSDTTMYYEKGLLGKATIATPIPTKTNNDFVRWDYTTSSGTTGSVNGGDTLKIGENVTFTAVWKSSEEETPDETEEVKATYKLNGGKITINSKEYTDTATIYYEKDLFGKARIAPPIPSKNGNDFVKWSYKLEGDDTTYTLNYGDYVSVSKNITLTAVWEEIEEDPDDGNDDDGGNGGTVTPDPTKYTYKATLDANGGKVNGNDTASVSCTTTSSSCSPSSIPTATREGYTFGGWGTSKTCTSGDKTSLTLNSTSGKTYYACWSGTVYQLTFNVNGGKLFEETTESTSLVRKISSVDYSKFTAKKDNNTFDGWSTDSTCTNPAPVKTGTLKLTKDTTLYACYTEDKEPGDGGTGTGDNKTYTVKFILNGGKLYKGATLQKSNTVTLSTIDSSEWTAKKEGNIFKYWSKNKDCSKQYAPKGSLTEDLELYACYDPDKTGEEVEDNSKTGSKLFLLFVFGIFALGFVWYSGYKYTEAKK